MSKKILLIFFLALLIRLIAVNQSLWLDEAVTANVVKNFGWLQIISKFSPTDFHPPLYYLFMKLWTGFFGSSEIALRMPSVLFSLATGWIIYLIAKKAFPTSSRSAGLRGAQWAAAFFLFNPLIVYYSQEARMYMMATFFLTAGQYHFLGYQKSHLRQDFGGQAKFKSILLMNLFFILSFYTFYGSIFLIAAVFIYLLYKKQYRETYISYFSFIVFFILISPLIHQQFINAKVTLTNVTNWTNVLGKANLKNLLLIPVKFAIGRIDFYPKWIYYLIAGLWTGFITYQILKIKYQNDKLKIKNIYLFYYLFIFPLLLGLLISFFTPLLQYFRFIYLIPIMSILLAFRLSGQPRTQLSQLYVLVAGFIIFSLVYLLLPQFHREDWKNLVKNLPKDKPVYMIVSSSDPITYYNRNLEVKELTRLRQDFGGQSELEKDIIVIPYTADIYGFDYQKILREKKYQLIDKRSFRGLVLEEYKL